MEVPDGARRSEVPKTLRALAPGRAETSAARMRDAVVHHERPFVRSVLGASDGGAAVSEPDLAEQAPRRRRVVGFLVGLVAFPGLAAVTGLLAIPFAYAAGAEAGLVVWVPAMAAPIVVLVRRGGRLRDLAYGMITSAAVCVVAVVVVPLLLSSGESPERQLVTIAAHSSTAVYYPGPSFEGHDFDDVVIFSHNSESGSDTDHSFDRGDRLDIGYGSTCGSFTETCGDLIDLEMYRRMLPFPPGYCAKRLEGPRGTLLVREDNGAWDAFTGDLVMRMEGVDKQGMVDLVTALRVVGDREPTDSQLPRPSATVLRWVRDACRP
jgi:hypothetical protein